MLAPATIVAGGVIQSNPDAVPVVPTRGGYVSRIIRITKEDLQKFWYTHGCPACLTAQLGDGITRGPHTAECRERMENALPDRKQKADQRIDQWMADQVEEVDNQEGDGSNVGTTMANAGGSSGSALTEAETQSTDGGKDSRRCGIAGGHGSRTGHSDRA